MRILIALTYYRPHISGLTMYAQRVAEALAGRGHQITVVTARYDQHLAREELRSGVRIIRAPVLARVGKGVVLPGYARLARRLLTGHDLLLVNYPITPPESDAWVRAAGQAQVPLLALHHCDIQLPSSPLRPIAQRWIEAAGRRLMAAATRCIVLSPDYAASSPLLRPHLDKCDYLPPPINLTPAPPHEVAAFRARHADRARVVIGLAARMAAEKGIDHLLAARATLRQALGGVRLLIAGEKREALGEAKYGRKIAPLMEAWGSDLTFVGHLSDGDMACFFGACDVTVLPSTNRTEAFGLVQVESMLCGTPVVASDLPGIRDAIQRSGMGRLAAPRDSEALARALIDVVKNRASLVRPPHAIRQEFELDSFTDRWHTCATRWARPAQHPATDEAALARMMRLHSAEIPPFRALVRGIESALIQRHAPRTGPVLDLGCGDGMFTALTLPTPVAYGVDPDGTDLDRARRTGIYEQLWNVAAHRIPLPDASCGMVLANSVLEHIPDLDPVLQETRRILRPQGWLVITAPNHRFGEGFGVSVLLDACGWSRWATRYRTWFNGLARHHHLDSAETWCARLHRHGFRVTHHEEYLSREALFWFDGLHYLSVPCLPTRRLLGRWHVLGHPLWAKAWTSWLTRLAQPSPGTEGACVFILAQKD